MVGGMTTAMRRPGPRQIDPQIGRRLRRRHHEDDQQHQQHVDERDDVRVGVRRKTQRAHAAPALAMASSLIVARSVRAVSARGSIHVTESAITSPRC